MLLLEKARERENGEIFSALIPEKELSTKFRCCSACTYNLEGSHSHSEVSRKGKEILRTPPTRSSPRLAALRDEPVPPPPVAPLAKRILVLAISAEFPSVQKAVEKPKRKQQMIPAFRRRSARLMASVGTRRIVQETIEVIELSSDHEEEVEPEDATAGEVQGEQQLAAAADSEEEDPEMLEEYATELEPQQAEIPIVEDSEEEDAQMLEEYSDAPSYHPDPSSSYASNRSNSDDAES